jgi:glycosyltransferase involved in cell wall biosynthesis
VSPHVIGVIPTIEPLGGAERVFARLMNAFREDLGLHVTVLTHIDYKGRSAWQGMTIPLRSGNHVSRAVLIPRLRTILQSIEGPAIVFPFQFHANILVGLTSIAMPFGLRHPIVANDRNNIQAILQVASIRAPVLTRPILRMVARRTYRTATHIVCNSIGNTSRVRSFVGPGGPPVHTIWNPVDAGDIQARCPRRPARDVGQAPVVTAHGRLDVYQKGWDVLIEAIRLCQGRFPGISLRLVGEGAGRPEILRLAAQHGVAQAIELTGHSADPVSEIVRGDLYVFPSRYEGLPNALLEALAAGLPIVASDCETGPREILDGNNGVLVEPGNAAQLAGAMLRLLSDRSERERLSCAARERAGFFTMQRAIGLYARLFEQSLSGHGTSEQQRYLEVDSVQDSERRAS